jgi:hypothetical protein
VADVSDSALTFEFDPSSVTASTYTVTATVTDSENAIFTAIIFVQVVAELETLSATDDFDGDGIPDSLEGFSDKDQDGIPDYLDAIDACNIMVHDVSSQDKNLMETEAGVCIRRGNLSLSAEAGGALLTDEDVTAIAGISADASAVNVGGIVDFVAYGLTGSETIDVVLPMRNPIPLNAIYRKFKDGAWTNFVEDENNVLSSAPGEPGICPSPGSDVWQAGLTAGHWCAQLTIQDGGPNDDDGEQNGAVVDPGFVGVLASDNNFPVANDAQINVLFGGTEYSVDLSRIVSDADGDALSLTSATASIGSVTIDGLTITYTPPEGFAGEAPIVYAVSDGNAIASGTIALAVVVNQAPALGEVTGPSVTQGNSATVHVLSSASDNEGDALEVTSASASQGSVVIESNGRLTFTAPTDSSGTVTVTYAVTDSAGNVSEGSFNVTVVEKAKFSGGGSNGLFGLLALCVMLWSRQAWLRRRHID